MTVLTRSQLRVIEMGSTQRHSLRGDSGHERSLRMRPCSLPRVWAVADGATAAPVKAAAVSQSPRLVRHRCRMERDRRAEPAVVAQANRPRLAESPTSRPAVEVAFYRKYTEAMLRRYLKLSMEAGRVPSLLGREMFRGHVTSYRVHSFEDVVLFCIDVERCLAKLNPYQQDLVRRVALQQYTLEEAAPMLSVSLRSAKTGYAEAIDGLTTMFMKRGMVEALKSCQ